MGFFGNFIGGAITGVVGLGLLSWIVTKLDENNDSSDTADDEEEE